MQRFEHHGFHHCRGHHGARPEGMFGGYFPNGTPFDPMAQAGPMDAEGWRDPMGGRGRGGGRHGGGHGGGHGDGRGGGAGRGGHRRRRLFDQAELQTLLLDLIAQAPRHGYDLIKEIETLSGGEYAPSPGVVYPALTYMEESGVIAQVAGESARKAFEATALGQQQVADSAEQIATLRARLESLADARERADPAPVRRALHNLRTAVIDRLTQSAKADRAQILQIADLIDETTRQIERLEL